MSSLANSLRLAPLHRRVWASGFGSDISDSYVFKACKLSERSCQMSKSLNSLKGLKLLVTPMLGPQLLTVPGRAEICTRAGICYMTAGSHDAPARMHPRDKHDRAGVIRIRK